MDSVAGLWAEQGHAGVSARAVAQISGLPTSSIYHHFGSLEQLCVDAQERVLMQAEAWCAVRLDLVERAPVDSADALAALFATLVDDWSHDHRPLAFAWRECQLLAARNPHYLPVLEGWRRLWSGFWQALSARCGFAAWAEILANMFDGESMLHLLHWQRLVDRSCLQEYARGLGNWLNGSLAAEGPWRRFAREEAARARLDLPEPRGAAAEIAAAAADVLERSGMAGLTHRAVAAEAGVTLGTVSYNFRTSSDLARATFETIYNRIVPPEGLAAMQQTNDRSADMRVASRLILALEELMVAAGRDPALRPFVPQLRYLRGRSSGPALQIALGRDVSSLDGALYSGFLSGQGRMIIGKSAEEARDDVTRTSDFLLAALRDAR